MPKLNLGKVIPTINNKVPQNGTLTIKAEDIPFDDGITVREQINSLDAEIHTPDFTTYLKQHTDIFSAGTGYDESGNYVDMSNSITKGQVSAVVKGETRTNLLTENQSSVEYDLTGFIKFNQATLSRDTTEKVFGEASLKVVTGGSTNVEGFRLLDVNCKPNTQYTASLYLKGSGNVVVRLDNRDANNTYISGIGSKTLTLTSSWQRIDLSGTTSTDAEKIALLVITNGVQAITFYADGLMIEEGGKLNNWISGTKSTISAIRLKSVGKNLFDINKLTTGTILDGNIVSGDTATYTKNGNELTIISSSAFRGVISDFIPVEPDTSYYLKMVRKTGVPYFSGGLHCYDINKMYLGATGNIQENGSAITLPNTKFVRLQILNNTITTTVLTDVQLEKGTVATLYEPYTESTQYFTAKDSNGNIVELRSLPNGTKDEVSVSGGKAELIKIVSDELTITGGSGFSIGWFAETTNSYYCIIPNWAISNNAQQALTNSGLALSLDGNYPISSDITDLFREIWIKHNNLYLKVEKTKVDTMTGSTSFDKFKNYLNQYPVTLTYQLATPIEIPVEVEGELEVYENGTMYVEAVRKITKAYETGIQFDVPINYVESVKKIVDNIKYDVELSKASINSNKVTITGATVNEIYEVICHITPSETTTPETHMKYPLNTMSLIEGNSVMAKNARDKIDSFVAYQNAVNLQFDLRLTTLE